MKIFYKKLLLLNSLICTSCFSSSVVNRVEKEAESVVRLSELTSPVTDKYLDTKELPKWVFNSKVFDGPKIIIVADGITKYEATIYGLSQFTQAVDQSGYTGFQEFDSGDLHDSFKAISTTLFSQSFGKILIEGRTESYFKEIGTDLNSEIMEYFEEIVNVDYENGNDHLQYSYFLKETGDDIESRIMSQLKIGETNCNLDCLLKELENIGFNYKFYFDESGVWFLLEKETAYPNVKAEIKKYKKMLDNNLIEKGDYNVKITELLDL